MLETDVGDEFWKTAAYWTRIGTTRPLSGPPYGL